ncbi:unnamed protein product [Urochloa decumbens]|uniref:Uncharacterized protein n=1 Tax=Urochloa decumbens TaxID=240449 RepID=A0ABC9G0X0_9POAL
MASAGLKPGVPVILRELEPSSEMFKQGASVRVTGTLQSYDVDSAIAVIQDGSVSLKIDTKNLRDVSFRTSSAYQFIGELLIRADNEVLYIALLAFQASVRPVWYICCKYNNPKVTSRIIRPHQFLFIYNPLQAILQARIGRNVDGLDLNLFQQSVFIRRQYEEKLRSTRRT